MREAARMIESGMGMRIGKRRSGLLRVRELRTVALLAIVVMGTYLIQPRYLNPNSLRSILIWIPLVAIIGMASGVITRTRISSGEAPSILAASTSS